MIDVHRIKDLLSSAQYSPTDKLLICLAVEPLHPQQVKEVRACAVDAGLRKAGSWNISRMLASTDGLAVRTLTGWELTDKGMKRVMEVVGITASLPSPKITLSLRRQLSQLKSSDSRAFLEEAILCFEMHLYRAAVVLTWVGAVSVLYEYVFANRLGDFNTEAARRDSKWKTVKIKDDLAYMKEYEFLQILEAISIIGKNVKQELEGCLRLRNACGHPTSLQVGESRTGAHIEILLLNVFAKY